MAYGKIRYVLRDAFTDEIISETEKENILTRAFFDQMAWAKQLNFRIAIADAAMESSVYTQFLSIKDFALYSNTTIPAVGRYIEFFPSTESESAFIQYSGRFSAPAFGTSRTIRTIALCAPQGRSTTNGAGSDYGISISGSDRSFAFAKLAEPCIQTDGQVLDVFYRVFFPFDETSGVSKQIFEELIKSYTVTSFGGEALTLTYSSPFKLPKLKGADVQTRTLLSKKGLMTFSKDNAKRLFASPTQVSGMALISKLNSTNAAFTDFPGRMISSTIYVADWVFTNGYGDYETSERPPVRALPISYSNLNGFSKIQNVIAQGAESTLSNSTPWLNVDNLPTGNGRTVIGGNWQNIKTPSAAGLYYSAELPELVRIKIETSGVAGVAEYKIVRQKYFGNTTWNNSQNMFTPHAIIPLCGEAISPRTNLPTSFSDKTLIGDVTSATFDVQQMSACDRFDDSSFVVVKKDEIILYNLAAPDYWRYSGGFTNAHQIAVSDNKIYVACRSTGLYVIDPLNSLSTIKVPNSAGLDFSNCYGVAKGYNNTIWAVTTNGLGRFDGAAWVKYDETSLPAFTMPGVSDGNWANIEYLKIDDSNIDNQMLLVRKSDATVDAAALGVWWSTTTAAVNAGEELKSVAASFHHGYPRAHRKHCAGQDGFWVIISQNSYRKTSFGSTAFQTLPLATFGTFNDKTRMFQYFQSVNFVRATDGSIRLLSFHDSTNTTSFRFEDGTQLFSMQPTLKLVGVDGTVSDTLSNSGLVYTPSELGCPTNYLSGDQLTYISSSHGLQDSSSGRYADKASWFHLSHGVIVSCSATIGSNSSTFANPNGVIFQAFNYGLNNTPEGGALKHLAQRTYGWDGTAWVLNGPARLTHTTAESLFDGITVLFEDGKTYNSPNVYKFGLVDGLLKDNATRANFNAVSSYHARTYKDKTEIEFATVPTLISGELGVISFDPYNSSGGVYLDGLERVNFPGQNRLQYAMGNKDLIGDFLIDIDVSQFNSDIRMRRTAAFGIARGSFLNSGSFSFGAFWDDPSYLYSLEQGTSIATIDRSALTSLQIRRIGGAVTMLRNGSVHRSSSSSVINNQTAFRMNAMFNTGIQSAHRQVTTYFPESLTICPKMTILANGSDIAVRLGNPILRTGAYADRFYCIDNQSDTLEIRLNGILAIQKFDGTLPAAGEVSIDIWRGIMYFHSDDIGKSITAKYTYLQAK